MKKNIKFIGTNGLHYILIDQQWFRCNNCGKVIMAQCGCSKPELIFTTSESFGIPDPDYSEEWDKLMENINAEFERRYQW